MELERQSMNVYDVICTLRFFKHVIYGAVVIIHITKFQVWYTPYSNTRGLAMYTVGFTSAMPTLTASGSKGGRGGVGVTVPPETFHWEIFAY